MKTPLGYLTDLRADADLLPEPRTHAKHAMLKDIDDLAFGSSRSGNDGADGPRLRTTLQFAPQYSARSVLSTYSMKTPLDHLLDLRADADLLPEPGSHAMQMQCLKLAGRQDRTEHDEPHNHWSSPWPLFQCVYLPRFSSRGPQEKLPPD